MTAPASKVSTFEMALWAERHADRLDAWERVHHSEGNDMPDYMIREREVARLAHKTLLLVMEFEAPFRDIVLANREARQRARRIRGEEKAEAEQMGVAGGQ